MFTHKKYKNPFPTVDIIIEPNRLNRIKSEQIILIKRMKPPLGWALPGGFVNYGETLEQAAQREAFEETGLKTQLLALIGIYSNPHRDPRQHILSVVFAAKGYGIPKANDEADKINLFKLNELPEILCFDHSFIISHYKQWRNGLRPAAPIQFY